MMADANGKVEDVVLGYDDIDGKFDWRIWLILKQHNNQKWYIHWGTYTVESKADSIVNTFMFKCSYNLNQ